MRRACYAVAIGWVLWAKIIDPSGEIEWDLKAAAEAKEECHDAARLNARVLVRLFTKRFPDANIVTVSPHGFVVFIPGEGRTAADLICLPDTIDPRPRK